MKELLHKLIKEHLNKKKYLGQCDELRKLSPKNEQFWEDMMTQRHKITLTKFMQFVDMTPLLDSDETPQEYILECKMSDPDTNAYVSKWGNRDCMFLQTAGFEFIFI